MIAGTGHRGRLQVERARYALSQKAARPAAARAEHISIEGEPERFSPPTKQPHRITRHSYTLASRLRGCSTELAILDGHYLGVRASGRTPPRSSTSSICATRIRSRCACGAYRGRGSWCRIGLEAMGVGALASVWSADAPLFSVARVGGRCCMCVGRRVPAVSPPYDGIARVSQHARRGDTRRVIGGIGSARNGKKFFVETHQEHQRRQERAPARQAAVPARRDAGTSSSARARRVDRSSSTQQSKARILASH